MRPVFYKLSHGTEHFNYNEILESIDKKLVYVHKDTGAKGTSAKTQAEDFIDAHIGDYFYLTRRNASFNQIFRKTIGNRNNR